MDAKFNVMPSKVLKQNKKLWINNEDLELALFYLLFLLLIFFLVIVVVSRRFMSPNPVYLASLLLIFWPFGAAGQNQESRTKRFVLHFSSSLSSISLAKAPSLLLIYPPPTPIAVLFSLQWLSQELLPLLWVCYTILHIYILHNLSLPHY